MLLQVSGENIMSRQYNPAIDAYRNMDIENLPDIKEEPETTGLLSKRSSMNIKGIDTDNPVVRVGMQMKVLRKHREEIKNATA
jgi:hypothetical protein